MMKNNCQSIYRNPTYNIKRSTEKIFSSKKFCNFLQIKAA